MDGVENKVANFMFGLALGTAGTTAWFAFCLRRGMFRKYE